MRSSVCDRKGPLRWELWEVCMWPDTVIVDMSVELQKGASCGRRGLGFSGGTVAQSPGQE